MMLDRLRAASEMGWLSIGFWICVQAVQIQENYVLQSGEGLSIFFVIIWLLGDLANLLGSFWQGLLPTVTYLGLYYVLCDVTLLFQVFYYREKRRRNPHLYQDSSADETTALLGQNGQQQGQQNDQKEPTNAAQSKSELLVGTVALAFVAAVGIFGWYITPPQQGKMPVEVWDQKAQIVGWISAILYLTSRLPQISKNTESKCEGLSLLFFFFALAGNLTFCASILIPASSGNHLIINMSWLVGSAGTVVLDLMVLGQFFYYAKDRQAIHEGKALHHHAQDSSGLAA